MSTDLVLSDGSPKLDQLPAEVLDLIILEILGIQAPLCASIHRGLTTWSVEEIPTFQQNLPKKMLQQLQKLLLTNKRLRAGTQHCLASHAKFYASSAIFSHFPVVVGLDTTKAIRKLSLRLSLGDRIWHEETWPELIRTLTQDLTSLTELTIETTWAKTAGKLDIGITIANDASCTRRDQEVALLIRLGAFTTLRHPTLNRLIWTVARNMLSDTNDGDDSARIILDRGTIRNKRDLGRKWESYMSEDQDGVDCVEDQILNASNIRTTKLDHLSSTPFSIFAISPHPCGSKDAIITSETNHPTRAFRIIDKRGYATEVACKAKGWGRNTVDELIDHCHDMQSKSLRSQKVLEMIASERGNRREAEEKLC